MVLRAKIHFLTLFFTFLKHEYKSEYVDSHILTELPSRRKNFITGANTQRGQETAQKGNFRSNPILLTQIKLNLLLYSEGIR